MVVAEALREAMKGVERQVFRHLSEDERSGIPLVLVPAGRPARQVR